MEYPSSRLPKVGTTIFSEMSALAAQHQAINLSQGFPDFDGPEALRDRVTHYLNSGANQYAPMAGMPQLRQALAGKTAELYQYAPCPESEITVTSGATEAIFAAIASVVGPGDEVILFDPAYDSYEPAIELNGGVAIRLPLTLPDFSVDWDQLEKTVTSRTRMIILNNPHNPTGATLSEQDLQQLSALVKGTNLLLLSDEVYEHIVFDGKPHLSLISVPELRQRSFIVSSFGKTYHTTGWKIGYCIAPEPLMVEFRKVHQYLTFSTSTPMQLALADYITAEPSHYQQLPVFYQHKRDRFNQLMESSRFTFTPARGTYFQLMDYSQISDLDDLSFCRWLTEEVGVAAIPISVFCQQPLNAKLVRFCFAKNEQTLAEAAQRLCRI